MEWMVTDELIAYITKRLSEGAPESQIRTELETSGGWLASDIDEGFAKVGQVTGQTQVFSGVASTASLRVPNKVLMSRIAVTALLLITAAFLAFFFWPNPEKSTQNNVIATQSDSLSGNMLEKDSEENPDMALLDIDAATKDWKTYRNEKYGFEFKYPAGLSVTSEIEMSGMLRVVVGSSIIVDAAKTYDKTREEVLKKFDPYSQFRASDIPSSVFTMQYSSGGANDPVKWHNYAGVNDGHFYKMAIITESEYDFAAGSDIKKSVESFKAFQPAKVDMKSSSEPLASLKVSKDWKLYQNIQFAYEISYPSDWSARENPQGVRISNYTNLLEQPEKPIVINVVYYQNDNPKKLSPENYISEEFNSIKTLFDRAKTRQSLVVNNFPAVKYVWEGDYSGSGFSPAMNTKTYEYYIMRGADVVNVKYVLQKDVGSEAPEAILSTLKFTAFNQAAYDSLLQKERSSVIGDDANNDGVWDYIEKWIDDRYTKKPNTRKSLRMMADDMQFDMLNYRDKDAIVRRSHQIDGYSCLKRVEQDSGAIYDEFMMQMINTEARVKAYFAADSQKGGQFYGLPSDEQVEEFCGF